MSKKNAKNQNALKHGAYSGQVLLPGEKRGEYEAFRQAHYDEFTPDGVTEEYVVDDLCSLRWQKRRMGQYNHIRLQQRKDEMLLANKASKFMEKLREMAPEFLGATSFAAVTAILSRLSVARQSGWEHSDNQDGHFGGRGERMIVAARR